MTVIPLAPCLVGYSEESDLYIPGLEIEPNAPQLDPGCGPEESYSIEPATLPAGLSFNVGTGVLSGVPTEIFPKSSFRVTARNPGGESSVEIDIRVTPVFHFTAPDQLVLYRPATGIANVRESLFVEENPQNPGFPNGIDALVIALTHDPDVLIVEDISLGSALEEVQAGSGPDFFSPTLFRDGFTVGIVIDFDVTEVLIAEGSREMLRVSYRTRLGALSGSPSGLSTTLVWENGWGDPPVDNLIAVDLEGIEPLVTDGIITLEPEP